MLNVGFVRAHKDEIIQRLNKRNIPAQSIIDNLLTLDDERKKAQQDYDDAASQINAVSKEIGTYMSQGNKEEAEKSKAKVADIKGVQKMAGEVLFNKEEEVKQALLNIPNAPQDIVPSGKHAEDNENIKQGGTIPSFGFEPLPHWELADKYKLIDFETGTKITGSGFILYTGQGAKLERALINFFLDYNSSKGYKEVLTPFLVNSASAYGTGQLPDKEGQMYFDNQDNAPLYLIPTAEVPVTNIYRDVIVPENELPIRLTAYSPCFRREAGSYGKDVKGLNRVHQFNKVEIVRLEKPENSDAALTEMVAHVEGLLQALELPYRILRLCGGDMGFASALTYDFEVYSTAQDKWLEVSSVSNFEAFQCQRLQARYRDTDGKMQILHSLNGSSLALPRIVATILENHQTDSGINIPKALQTYFGADCIK